MLASAPIDAALDLRQNPLATLDAIHRLDFHLADCDGPVARGILLRAITYLEASLRTQLTGPERA